MKDWLRKALALLLCLCVLLPAAALSEEEAGAEEAEAAETAEEPEAGAEEGNEPAGGGEEDLMAEFTLTHGDRQSNKIAITVDDCWASSTKHLNKIIDLCEQYHIPVTFFALDKGGCLTPKYRDMWQRALDAGCEIGSHYYNHVFMGSRDNWTIIRMLGRWQEDLDKTLGYHYQIRWLRPPYGNIEDQHLSKRSTQRMTKVIKIFGFDHIVRWDVSDTVASDALEHVQNGSILLFHGKNKDVKCLEELIPALIERGYQLVTVSELFGYPPPETSSELYVYRKEDYEGR